MGLLAKVIYSEKPSEEDKPNMVTAKVVAESGSTVNMRKAPQKTAAIIAQVPVGREVVIEQQMPAGWCQVTYEGYTGYMMTQYLREMNGNEQPSRAEFEALVARVAALEKLVASDERLNNGG